MNRLFLALAGICMVPTPLYAQVVNGDFANSTASWTWLRSLATSGNCSPVVYTPNGADAPNIGVAPASGRVAALYMLDAVGIGTQTSCKEIRQTLTVPAGSQLRFDAQLGIEDNSFPTIFAPVTLSVAFITGGQTHYLFSVQGQTTSTTSCQAFNDCPRYAGYTVNMTQFAGRSGVLSFLATTQANAYPTRGSSAFVDNIAFEPAPPPPPPPTIPPAPTMLDPTYQGGNHRIAWTSNYSSARYLLHRSINQGAWTEIYKGSNRSWSAATPSSGDYRYRVAIISGSGNSPFSREVTGRPAPTIMPIVNYLLH